MPVAKLTRDIIKSMVYRYFPWQDNINPGVSPIMWDEFIRPVNIVPLGKTVDVFSPHYDDIFFGMLGTVLKMQEHGSEVQVVTPPPGKDIEKEFMDICGSINVKVKILEFMDGTIYMQKSDADIVFCTSDFDLNHDHRAGYNMIAVKRKDLWCYNVYQNVGNVIVDITSVIETKRKIISRMDKIFRNRGKRDWNQVVIGRDAYNSRFIYSSDSRWGELLWNPQAGK